MEDIDQQVFISYSSKDVDIANGIVNKLQMAGIRSWIAPRDIPIGSDYTAAIPEGIERCPFYLVLLSHNSIASLFVKKEMVHAVNQNRYILPLLLDRDIAVEKIVFLLNNVQFRPYYENQEAVLDEVIGVIQSRRGPAPVTRFEASSVFRSKIGHERMRPYPYSGAAKFEPLTPYAPSAEERFSEAKIFIGQGYYKEAIVPLTIAADAGYTWAQFELGNCYRYGYGTEKDAQKSNYYYQMAAVDGHCEAQFLLGYHYFCGNDMLMAKKWFALAAAQGHVEAAEKLKFICKIAVPDIPNQVVDVVSEAHKDLLKAIIQACRHLQSHRKYWGWNEDDRNDVVRNSLRDKDYIVYDQTRKGISESGIGSGELDMDIRRLPAEPWTICEALIVKGYTKEWNEHLDKLLNNYNPYGLSVLYLLTYVDSGQEKFGKIWDKYQTHICEDQPAGFMSVPGSVEMDLFSDYESTKVARCQYNQGSYIPMVYHIFVRIGQ